MRLSDTPLIDAVRIAARVRQLANEISADYAQSEIVLLTVLKGSFLFAADLLRALSIGATIDFVQARSYDGTNSTGEVHFLYLPETAIAGKHVLIVEDILDTGRTAAAILEHIAALGPASVRLCALLDKPARRVTAVSADYVGFPIGDEFVVGYGLDYEERYRELPAVYTLLSE